MAFACAEAQVLVVANRAVYRADSDAQLGDPPGVWDVLHQQVGARNAPLYHTMPWMICLRTGVTVTVNSDGRIRCLTGSAPVAEVEAVEEILMGRCGARWVDEGAHAAERPSMQITYGTPGSQARQLSQPPSFR